MPAPHFNCFLFGIAASAFDYGVETVLCQSSEVKCTVDDADDGNHRYKAGEKYKDQDDDSEHLGIFQLLFHIITDQRNTTNSTCYGEQIVSHEHDSFSYGNPY